MIQSHYLLIMTVTKSVIGSTSLYGLWSSEGIDCHTLTNTAVILPEKQSDIIAQIILRYKKLKSSMAFYKNLPPVESKLYLEEHITELGWCVKHIRSAPCFLWYVVFSNLESMTKCFTSNKGIDTVFIQWFLWATSIKHNKLHIQYWTWK